VERAQTEQAERERQAAAAAATAEPCAEPELEPVGVLSGLDPVAIGERLYAGLPSLPVTPSLPSLPPLFGAAESGAEAEPEPEPAAEVR
jgi:hypothetical protein